MSDKLLISDLKVQAHIGCSPEERQNPQQLSVSLYIKTDLSKAARTKELTDTINYLTLSEQVAALAESKDWTLIEEFAAHVIDDVLAKHPRAEKVAALVKKFVIKDAAWVGVELKRERED